MTTKAESFMTQVEDKIRALLKEFSEGQLNSEQFHALYERYSAHRLIAQQALLTGDTGILRGPAADPTTLAVRKTHMGKAIGLGIYLNTNGAKLETLGDFQVSAFRISPVLNEFRRLNPRNRAQQPRAERLADKSWLLFTGAHYTTVVTLFRNEPSPFQMGEIQRLQHDFELANAPILGQANPDSQTLAYPFHVFIQRKLRQ